MPTNHIEITDVPYHTSSAKEHVLLIPNTVRYTYRVTTALQYSVLCHFLFFGLLMIQTEVHDIILSVSLFA